MPQLEHPRSRSHQLQHHTYTRLQLCCHIWVVGQACTLISELALRRESRPPLEPKDYRLIDPLGHASHKSAHTCLEPHRTKRMATAVKHQLAWKALHKILKPKERLPDGLSQIWWEKALNTLDCNGHPLLSSGKHRTCLAGSA